MDIYVISLEKSGDRKQIFDNYNLKYIKYNYHKAVDGSTLQNIDKTILKKGATNYSNNAIGCAMSHLQLWEKCIELNKPIIIMNEVLFCFAIIIY